MKSGRVVLADSHLGLLSGIHALLQTVFESVLMVADEHSLEDALTTCKPDLVVVDLSLPHEGEVNVVMHLRKVHPQLRLLALSVHDDPTVMHHVLSAGVAAFVLKRAIATDLIPAITEVLRGTTGVCPRPRRNTRTTER